LAISEQLILRYNHPIIRVDFSSGYLLEIAASIGLEYDGLSIISPRASERMINSATGSYLTKTISSGRSAGKFGYPMIASTGSISAKTLSPPSTACCATAGDLLNDSEPHELVKKRMRQKRARLRG